MIIKEEDSFLFLHYSSSLYDPGKYWFHFGGRLVHLDWSVESQVLSVLSRTIIVETIYCLKLVHPKFLRILVFVR